MKGRIIKGVGGFYTIEPIEAIESTTEAVEVATDKGEAAALATWDQAAEAAPRLFTAQGRGLLKKQGLVLTVGDEVTFQLREDGDAWITQVLPRRNRFVRPPIANVDLIVTVAAMRDPRPNLELIDRFLIMAEASGAETVLCLNKTDLAETSEVARLTQIYQGACPVLPICGRTGMGMDQLKELIQGRTAALAGPSGAGKSTVINWLIPHADMETGSISNKTGRGKHTTRHVELFRQLWGSVFDTPGFTSFDILEVTEEELAGCYPELAVHAGQCKFDDCRHSKEPGCAVRAAVEAGQIPRERYRSYQENLATLQQKKRY